MRWGNLGKWERPWETRGTVKKKIKERCKIKDKRKIKYKGNIKDKRNIKQW